jgi:hypothetical protein
MNLLLKEWAASVNLCIGWYAVTWCVTAYRIRESILSGLPPGVCQHLTQELTRATHEHFSGYVLATTWILADDENTAGAAAFYAGGYATIPEGTATVSHLVLL